MSENLDTLLLHVEQLSPTLPAVLPVNGCFSDPRQIARALRFLNDENWQYIGDRHIGGHNGVHLLGCADEYRPLFRGADGTWYLARKDCEHYGDPDRAGTLMLLKYAQDNNL
jgi:hypothetical protein